MRRGVANTEVFKALADPTRREILRLLAGGEKSAGELAERFDMTKPTVSHHFAVLKAADLVRTRREGQSIRYSLNTTVMQDILTWMWDAFGKRTGDDAGAGNMNAREGKA
jgi:DNA-binding transcriptional ArsR family regulator